MQDLNYIDSHVHLDHIPRDNPERISWMYESGCLPVSWAFEKDIQSKVELEVYLKSQSETIHAISKRDLECYYFSGIHPRVIPRDLKAKEVKDLIMPFLDDPLCLGIGEIGLEKGETREKESLHAHLVLIEEVVERGKVIGIHTPREQKAEIAAMVLSLLEDFSDWNNHILIDHCSFETIGDVLACNYWAGVTLSPVKCSPEDVRKIVQAYQQATDSMLLNTDSGSHFYEDLYYLSLSQEFSKKIRSRIIRKNAAKFFGLKRE